VAVLYVRMDACDFSHVATFGCIDCYIPFRQTLRGRRLVVKAVRCTLADCPFFSMAAASAPPPLPRLTSCVVVETSLGPITVGLFGEECPEAALNFLGLCHVGFYNGTYVRRVIRGQLVEVRPHDDVGAWSFTGLVNGDPAARVNAELRNQQAALRGPGGCAVPGRVRLDREGLLVMVPDGDAAAASSASGCAPHSCTFAITLAVTKPLDHLQRRCVVLGIVLEGMHVLRRLNASALVDPATGFAHAGVSDGAPAKLCRLKRTHVVEFGPAFESVPRLAGAFDMAEFVKGRRRNDNSSPASSLPPAAILLDGEERSSLHRMPPRYNPHEFFGFLPSDDDDDATPDNAGSSSTALNDLSRSIVTLQRAGGGAAGVGPYRPGVAAGAAPVVETDADRRVKTAIAAANRARVERSRTLMLQLLGELPDDDSGVAPPENVLFVCRLNPYTSSDDLSIIFGQFGKVESCEVVKDPKTGHSLQYAFVEFATVDQCQKAYLKMENVLIDDSRIHVDFCQSVAGIWKKRKAEGAAHGRHQPRTATVGTAVKRGRDDADLQAGPVRRP
jgi:cyclophilin family peptidyl-prolyl cis-trans isomerase